MEIPNYKLKMLFTHFKRIVENVRCDSADTRTINALRLARRDLRDLKKYIDKTRDNV